MFRPLLDIYILTAAGYCLTGWGLSLIRSLNAFGYLVASFCIIVFVLFYLKGYYPAFYQHRTWRNWRFQRFRKWLPGSFLILAVLIFFGGVAHEPNNHDGLSYRTATRLLRASVFEVLGVYIFFIFPNSLRVLRSPETKLCHFPLGAQYMVAARKP